MIQTDCFYFVYTHLAFVFFVFVHFYGGLYEICQFFCLKVKVKVTVSASNISAVVDVFEY